MEEELQSKYLTVCQDQGETAALIYCDEDWAELVLLAAGFPKNEVTQFINECWESYADGQRYSYR